MKIDRAEVEAMLALARANPMMNVRGDFVAALCRLALEVMDAPEVDFWLGYDEYGVEFDGDSEEAELATAKSFAAGLPPSQRVRLVRVGEG